MVKEVCLEDKSKSYVLTTFERYKEEHEVMGLLRYVLTEKLFLTLQVGYQHYFEEIGCCWAIRKHIVDANQEYFFKLNKFGYRNECYGRYCYVDKLEGRDLEQLKGRSLYRGSDYIMMEDEYSCYNGSKKQK